MLAVTSRAPDGKALFFAFLVLLVWLPMPLGSNRVWAWSIMEVWVLVLSLLWLVQYMRGRVAVSQAFLRAVPVSVCLLFVCVWVQLQAVALPAGLLQFLSPAAYDIHTATNTDFTISLNVYATRVSVLQSTSYLLVFWLTLLLVNDRQRLRLLAYALIISGVFQAVYGSLMTLSGIEYGFFLEKEAYLGRATGTFVNRNHLAGYLEICLAVGVGLMIGQLSGSVSTTWRDRALSFFQALFSLKVLVRLGLVFMVIGLVLTRSRGGNTAFFVSMLVVGIFYIVFVRRLSRGVIIFFVSMLVIDLLLVANFFGIEKVAERMQQVDVDQDTRTFLYQDTLGMVSDYPLTGSGAGSFYSVFPMYNTGQLQFGFFKHAHNDYLEFTTDLGLIALVALAFSVLLSLWQGVRAQLERRSRLMRGMGFGATMAIIALLIHSVTDFNLHIPANAATFMVVLALAWTGRFGGGGGSGGGDIPVGRKQNRLINDQ